MQDISRFFFLVVVEKLSRAIFFEKLSRANWQVSNPNWTKSAFLLSAQMWEPYPVVMSAHEHKMHRAMQILLLCRHSGPCEHKLPRALLILSLLSDNRGRLYCARTYANTNSILIITIHNNNRKDIQAADPFFSASSFFPCSGFVATESIYFRWSLLALQTRMAPVNTSESNQLNYTEAERVLHIADQLTHAIHASIHLASSMARHPMCPFELIARRQKPNHDPYYSEKQTSSTLSKDASGLSRASHCLT
jgi:hypothetical protein